MLLGQARDNLGGHAAEPLAAYALRLLDGAPDGLRAAMEALPGGPDLAEATGEAAEALAAFREWLAGELPTFTGPAAVGPEAFAFFLHRVALLPYPAARLREMGRQEWDRAVTPEAILRRRHRRAPVVPVAEDPAAHVERQRDDEAEVRRFSLSYQIGKLQVHDLLAAAQLRDGDGFDLMTFHDRLWREGNVPLALQRWELLGDRTQLDEADALAGGTDRGSGATR